MRSLHTLAALGLVATAAVVPPSHAQSAMPTLVLTSASAIAVPPPSADTAAELAQLREARAARSADLARRLRRWENGGPIYLWNQLAIDAMIERGIGNAPASRVLALLHAALYDATVVVAAAQANHARQPPAAQDATLAVAGVRIPDRSYPSGTAALGVVAATVLAQLVPAEAERFRRLAAEGDALRREAALEFPSDAAAGRAIGEAIAVAALARAADDGFSRRWSGVVPTGAGMWTGPQPAVPGNATWRAYVLPANNALRPPAPPSFGSPVFLAALTEVRVYNRSPQAVDQAVYWHAYGGGRAFQLWHRELSLRALEGGLTQNPVRLAASYAAVAIAFHDAHIACWDAKYAYWYIRPSQADTAITTLVPLPPHPSFPSAHSCLSNGAATVLAGLFPGDAAHFRALTQASGEARIAAGLHYRYDIAAGEEIGRRAAELTLERLAPALGGE
ncbi:MAG: hypothetical protein JWO26_137 [Rhodospirillales bacterium]|nr:hypothetical protein [Rhodospirillales bacterium]